MRLSGGSEGIGRLRERDLVAGEQRNENDSGSESKGRLWQDDGLY
jgi:hypothetical protein